MFVVASSSSSFQSLSTSFYLYDLKKFSILVMSSSCSQSKTAKDVICATNYTISLVGGVGGSCGHVYVYAYIQVHKYTSIQVWRCAGIHACNYTSVYAHTYTGVHVHLYTCVA